MTKQDAGYDLDRYRKLLAEAVDETKRLELIDIVIKEGARDKLETQRTSDRLAMTAATVARVLGPLGSTGLFPRRDHHQRTGQPEQRAGQQAILQDRERLPWCLGGGRHIVDEPG